MQARAITLRVCWDVPAEAVDASQQWVLTAMGAHGPALITMLWRILGNEQDVCDAYQETFLQLAHCLDGQKPQRVKGYLFRTAGNVAISMLRRRKSFDKACCRYAQDLDPRANADVTEELDTKEMCQRLRDYVARLPDGLREVIVLHDLAELPYASVGAILGISTGSARVYRCRAMQLLAAWMR